MLNKPQIKLVQTAVRSAGLRVGRDDGRYRLLLGQYLTPAGRPVESCKQLNNRQLDDILAICESLGWRYPGQDEFYYRKRSVRNAALASFAQRAAVKHLAGDLGFTADQLGGLIGRMTEHAKDSLATLTPGEAYGMIEALKSMLMRRTGKQYHSCQDVQADMEVTATDGQDNAS